MAGLAPKSIHHDDWFALAGAEVRFVDEARGYAEAVRAVEGASSIAVDTEQDAFFSYRAKICLLQIGVDDRQFIIDTVALPDLSALAAPLADPSKIKIFHAGDNDIALLRRDHRIVISGLFDTMSAAAVLGYKRTGLAALLEQHFQVVVEKKYQRSDWRKRPLEPAQIDYAALDVRYLDELRLLLRGELEQLGRIEEAYSDFQRIERADHESRNFDPNDYYRIEGARSLDGIGRRVLSALFDFRDQIAREEDRAPYRVCPDFTLLEIARRQPVSLGALRAIRGLPERFRDRGGAPMVDCIEQALARGELAPPPPAPREGPVLDDRERAIFDKLRDWRRKRAEARGVDAGRVVSNALLISVVKANPRDLDELGGAGFEPWRVREYGEEVLAILTRKKSPPPE